MTNCVFCGGQHDNTDCPMFGKTDAYLNAFAPKALPLPEEPSRSSLPPTQFEELFGAEPGLLADVADGPPEYWTPEQQALALKILAGESDLRPANNEDRRILDGIAEQMATLKDPRGKPPATLPTPIYRPPGVHTQAEMENFEEEYQPPVAKRDWPLSPDHPEGEQ